MPTGESENQRENSGRLGVCGGGIQRRNGTIRRQLFPEGCGGKVGIYYYESFGVCGTGLETRDITFDDGRKGRMGIYDGGATFSFITFPEQELSSGSFVAVAEGAGDWLAEQEEEVLRILGAAVMEEEE